MTEGKQPDDPHEGFTDEELRRLDSWAAPAPPADFAARVMSRVRAQAASGAGSARGPQGTQGSRGAGGGRPPMSRAERERRQRRRAVLATVLGAVALSSGGGFVASQAAATAGPAAFGAMTVYIAALAFGGILLVASLIGGHDHADHHAGGHDQGQGDAHGHGHDADLAPHAALVLPFLSLRFWIFGLAFFGLTGAVLHGLGLTSPLVAAVIATVLGIGFGYGAARVFQALAAETVGQVAPDGGHVGREGKLLLPAARGQRGKVRVISGGVAVDLLAECDDERELPAGTTVLVVAMRGTVAVVERSPAPSDSPPEQGDPT
ncbi:MAG TPA: NfeD family protein [Polyangia bacterium]|jgi:membrane protein implicated in regulation of membrane protease activity